MNANLKMIDCMLYQGQYLTVHEPKIAPENCKAVSERVGAHLLAVAVRDLESRTQVRTCCKCLT